jgi:tetratricopeptide (TPR) repeat protein/MoxR-like ATPase
LHRAGPRARAPFVDVNCAAIPETLLEAELFGFERGAFTDARQAKAGLFQTAHHGTLFLDEIGLLPEALQSKLLTVIEERAVRRLGATRSEPVDVWIITATNEDLAGAARRTRFREDLYHRLAVLTVWLPPLRERGRDIVLLAEHFLARAGADYGLLPKTLGPDARAALQAYLWPGNIRELNNVMERVALLAEEPVVTAAMLGLTEGSERRARPRASEPAPAAEDPVARLERERDELIDALRETDWNISRAAGRLGVPRNTLRYRIEKHGLKPGAMPPPRRRPATPPVPTPAAPAPAATAPAEPAPAVPATPTPSGLRWEQRRLALLRAVLAGGPAAEDLRPDAAGVVEVLVEKVRSFGGRIEELGRTGVVAVFGLDRAEDALRRAAHAAMAIQKLSERARSANLERPAVRVGIHTGQMPVVQGSGMAELDPDARREAWAVLGKVTETSEPDTILVSAAAATLLERRFELTPVAKRSEAGPVFRLTGLERAGPRERRVPFVGRQDELFLLQSRLASAMRGQGQVVGIGGEAGIGKSRLLFEFRQRLAGQPVTYLEGRCLSYATATAYHPIVEMLRRNCRIEDSDSPDVMVSRVRAALDVVGMDPDAAAPYLLHLLGLAEGTERLAELSPEAVQQRLYELLWQISLRGSQRRPLVLAVEDTHWIDRASEAYLESLVDSLGGAAILLLVTYRPGYRPRWLDKSYATQIALQALSPEDSLTVVSAMLRSPRVPDPVVRRLVDRASGNPFFLEELAHVVGEQGEAGETPAVPETVQEVIEARIDRLADEPRGVLQAAAILGREASLRLLRAIWDGPGGPEVHLRELMRLEFLYDRAAGDEPVYIFKHALTRDVARDSLTAARRQALHAAAGRALEGFFADRVDEVGDRLAYHYSKGKVADKAVHYLTRLAEKAAQSYAHVEAVTALEEALAHVDRLPDEERAARRLDLVLRQAHSLSFLGRFRETLELLRREEARLSGVVSPALAAPYHFWLAHTHSYLAESEAAMQWAEQALAEAEQAGDVATMGKAHVVLAQEHYWAGQPIHGIARGRRGVRLCEQAGERWWLGLAHWTVGINALIVGDFDAALAAEASALAVGEALGDRRIESYATWSTGWMHALTGAWEAGIDACRRGLGYASDPVNTAVALGHLGYVYLEMGDPTEARPLLAEAVTRMREFQFRRLLGRFTTFLGEAELLAGRTAEARLLVEEGLRVSTEARYWYAVGWAQAALGKIARAEGQLDAAVRHLVAARETFNRIHARFMIGRTAMALAELAQVRGDQVAAAHHLQEAYNVFRVLRVTRHLARVSELAGTLGVTLSDEGPTGPLAVVRRGEDELYRTLEEHAAALDLRGVIWDRREDEAGPSGPADDRRGPVPPGWDALGFLLSP